MDDPRKRFIQQMTPYALEASRATGVDPRIIIGQAALESGFGKSAPGQNYFGIKSHGLLGGQTLPTNEYGSDGLYRTNDSFRQYGSMAESAADYAKFINENKRYSGLRQAQGLDAQLAELQKSGYATDPNYSSKVGAIAKSINLDDGSYNPVVAQAPVAAPALPAATPAATPAAPVYSADLGTAARWLGNKIAPDMVDAPTPLTPEQVTQQNADLASYGAASKGLGGVSTGLLQLAKLAEEPKQEQMPMLQAAPMRRVEFVPLKKMRGLL